MPPLYEYHCTTCNEKEEKIQPLDAPVEHDCTKCGTHNGMRRILSTAAFALTGGGWFREGYQKK